MGSQRPETLPKRLQHTKPFSPPSGTSQATPARMGSRHDGATAVREDHGKAIRDEHGTDPAWGRGPEGIRLLVCRPRLDHLRAMHLAQEGQFSPGGHGGNHRLETGTVLRHRRWDITHMVTQVPLVKRSLAHPPHTGRAQHLHAWHAWPIRHQTVGELR